ncbi:MAG: SH3 domain-containing protein [Chloroflexota bacterium]|nr:SH3 domain-containing protein [Chloroflexota bacterium]
MKRSLALLLITLLFLITPFAVRAQAPDGELALNLPPIIVEIAAGETRTYTYTLTDARIVQLQAFGQSAQPTITLLSADDIIAAQTNVDGAFTVALSAIVSAGTYTVEVGTANDTSGQVVIVVISETPIPSEQILPNVPISGSISPENPVARYTISAAPNAARLLIEAIPDGSAPDLPGVSATLADALTGETLGSFRAPVRGASFTIPAGSINYTVEIRFAGGAASGEPVYSVCLEVDFSGACEARNAAPPVATLPPASTLVASTLVVPTQAVAACTVTPNAPAVNIRQSASTNAPIVGALTTGMTAAVIGMSPDGAWYAVQVNSLNGWVALAVVNATGNCVNVAIVQPPAFVAPPTAAPTQPPAPPTQPPSGPCLIRITGELLVYTQPTADPSFIFDELQPGYELIPVGRLADNSWWKTNYANSWIETSFFGNRAQVSGDCSALPVVAA